MDRCHAAVNDAIAACNGDVLATVRALVVANNYLLAQNDALNAELDQAWQCEFCHFTT